MTSSDLWLNEYILKPTTTKNQLIQSSPYRSDLHGPGTVTAEDTRQSLLAPALSYTDGEIGC